VTDNPQPRGGTLRREDPLLDIENLRVSFGALDAVAGVDLAVSAGEVVGLIGPNGAGKTSFLDGVSGIVRATGRVVLAGREISSLPPYARVGAGLSRTFQTSEVVHDLTIAEIIGLIAPWWRKNPLDVDSPGKELLNRVVEELRLSQVLDRTLVEVTSGIRRCVGVAAAVATQPVAILFDEPAAGLTAEEKDELTRIIRFLGEYGLGVLVVDHNVGFIANACDYVHMMHLGKVVFSGLPDEMFSSHVVDEFYLAGSAGEQ